MKNDVRTGWQDRNRIWPVQKGVRVGQGPELAWQYAVSDVEKLHQKQGAVGSGVGQAKKQRTQTSKRGTEAAAV